MKRRKFSLESGAAALQIAHSTLWSLLLQTGTIKLVTAYDSTFEGEFPPLHAPSPPADCWSHTRCSPPSDASDPTASSLVILFLLFSLYSLLRRLLRGLRRGRLDFAFPAFRRGGFRRRQRSPSSRSTLLYRPT
jgi:hypothetical protein